MSSPRDDLHNVFLADCSVVAPNKNNITVQGILEKSQTITAFEVWSSKVCRPAKAV